MTWLKQNWFKLIIAVSAILVAISVVMGIWVNPYIEENRLTWCYKRVGELTEEERDNCNLLVKIEQIKSGQ